MSPTHLSMAQKNKRVSTGGGQKILRYYNGYKQVHSLSVVLNFHGVNDQKKMSKMCPEGIDNEKNKS